MLYFWKVLFVIILVFVKQEADLALSLRKFVHQKDMSEHCRRRVMPSVFLGKQVVDAYSQILHFSRLELPYSCFIGVRTESGSNIILVIQLVSNKTLIESCRANHDQLLVYELGETFGGYWGALPHGIMETNPKKDEQQYTIKTTQPTTTTKEKTTTDTPPPTTSTTEAEDVNKPAQRPKDYIMEIPIVNVSFEMVSGKLPPKAIFDTEDSFDRIVDVKPWPNVTYKTKVLPLLQFSLEDKDVRDALRTTVAVEPELPQVQVDFNPDIFTPDYRLSYNVFNLPSKRPQHKYKFDHRLDFKKNKMLLAEKHSLFLKTSLPMFQYPTFVSRAHDIFTSHYRTSQSPLNKEHSKSWDAVNAILKNLNRSEYVASKTKVDDNVAKLLQGLAKIGPNETGLVANASSVHSRPSVTASWHSTTKYKTDSITWRQPSATYRTNYLDDEVEETVTTQVPSSMTSNIDGSTGVLLPVLGIDTVILNVTHSEKNESSTLNESVKSTAGENGTSTTFATTSIEKPLTLVDHESWENMVHAASLMAVALNQSVTSREDVDTQGDNVTTSTLSSTTLQQQRKKRYIHAIPIEHVKPHYLPIKMEIPTTTPYSDKISNAHEFQRRIELQDDEIHDRVALRYLRQYVGPVLFNICDFDEAAARHVYLFNSSRLVLAISNFTLERMTVVVTPARTLLSSDAQCPTANLECQVSGARVCIDSLSACDGVPNCGSYDIYDEDRLTCGRSAGLQHNVCLAAITFLAVLLTLLYIVHYWLKRCVPKVSDAFFIYTDAAENVLYLEPIMRSPYDTEDLKVFYRGGVIHDDMECTDIGIKRKSISPFIRFLSLFRRRCHSKSIAEPVKKEQEIDMDLDRQRMFSYGEVELTRLGASALTDTAVQTGSSLIGVHSLGSLVVNVSDHVRSSVVDSEMEEIVTYYEEKRRSTESNFIELEDRVSTERLSKELSILEFFKRFKPRSVSVDMPPYHEEISSEYLTQLSPQREEEEIQSLDYDPSFVVPASVTSMNTDVSGKKIGHANVQKKLRFEDIGVSSSENVNVEGVTPERGRRSVVYGTGKNSQLEQSDSAGPIDEPSTSTKKAYFWASSKNKPKKATKKKTQLLSTRTLKL